MHAGQEIKKKKAIQEGRGGNGLGVISDRITRAGCFDPYLSGRTGFCCLTHLPRLIAHVMFPLSPPPLSEWFIVKMTGSANLDLKK